MKQDAADGTELPFVVDAFTGANLANAVNASLKSLSNRGAPTIIEGFANPSSADLNAGKVVGITLAISEAVTVTGAPTLALDDDGTAIYVAARSTPTALAFDYTVAPGENTAALSVMGISLNGGAIQNSSGNAADLSNGPVTFADIQIDTTPPTISINPIATEIINAAESGQGLQITGAPRPTAEDGWPVAIVLNGITYTGQVSSNAWSVTVPKAAVQNLADQSTYTVTADVSDRAGNAAPEATRNLMVDADQAVMTTATLAVNDTADHVDPNSGRSDGGAVIHGLRARRRGAGAARSSATVRTACLPRSAATGPSWWTSPGLAMGRSRRACRFPTPRAIHSRRPATRSSSIRTRMSRRCCRSLDLLLMRLPTRLGPSRFPGSTTRPGS